MDISHILDCIGKQFDNKYCTFSEFIEALKNIHNTEGIDAKTKLLLHENYVLKIELEQNTIKLNELEVKLTQKELFFERIKHLLVISKLFEKSPNVELFKQILTLVSYRDLGIGRSKGITPCDIFEQCSLNDTVEDDEILAIKYLIER